MPGVRVCPACGSDEFRRSRKRGIWEILLSNVGIRPYVCKTCRNRFFGSKVGGVPTIITLVSLLLLVAAAGVWWYSGDGNSAKSHAKVDSVPVTAPASNQAVQLRGQIAALADSLAEIRREKTAIMAELSLLRGQLQAVKSSPAQPAPQAAKEAAPAPMAARTLLGSVGFSPGSAELDLSARQALARIAARAAQIPGARVLAEGAADSSPMGAQNAARFGDNAGLAMARALSVFRALQQMGVEQGRLAMAALGRPESSKDAGRTVRIWLIPSS